MAVRQRVRVFAVVAFVLLASGALAVQAATTDRTVQVHGADQSERYPGNTIVGVHSWENTGRLVEIAPNGSIVWEFDVARDSRFFGIDPVRKGELTPIGRASGHNELLLSAFAEIVPAADCPDEFLDHEATFPNSLNPQDHCVKNRVVLLDRRTDRIRWEYSWFDEMVHWHEVHDAIVTDDGSIAIIDMGNDRVFTVNAESTVTWEWQAEEYIGEGTQFHETYGGPIKHSEHDDWTHMNDIDQLDNGNFQLSIRNFDMIIEIDPESGEIVDTIGSPGQTELMRHQHNPQPLEAHGTIVVADSENDRIVEIDKRSEEIVWTYAGPPGDPLQWPRDADRLPNGNTLITDSRNNRIVEINETGAIVWSFTDPDGEVIPLPYVADRLPHGEKAGGPPGDQLGERATRDHGFQGLIRSIETQAWWVLPRWMHLPQIVNAVGILLGIVWLGAEGVIYGLKRREVPTLQRLRS